MATWEIIGFCHKILPQESKNDFFLHPKSLNSHNLIMNCSLALPMVNLTNDIETLRSFFSRPISELIAPRPIKRQKGFEIILQLRTKNNLPYVKDENTILPC